MSDALHLPPSYSWGEWSGDYRIVMKGPDEICRVGGVMARTMPDARGALPLHYAWGVGAGTVIDGWLT